ncbi:MAG: hypothetical protein IJM83_00460 [Firmicutes bacterium]|nr:hypothetical protein [Bacillota bacterium]
MKIHRTTILLLVLTILLTGCSTQGALTPKQLLDQTDLRTLVGQTKETIWQMFLLTDETVVPRGTDDLGGPSREDAGIFLLPFVQQPSFADALANDEWAVELIFVSSGNPAEDPVLLSGFRLMAAYKGDSARSDAEALLQKVNFMLSQQSPMFAHEAVSAEMIELKPQEWTDIFDTLGQMDPSYTHMVRITYRVSRQDLGAQAPVSLPNVIPEETYLRKTQPVTWLFREAGLGYILLFIAIGAIVIFIRKKGKKQ